MRYTCFTDAIFRKKYVNNTFLKNISILSSLFFESFHNASEFDVSTVYFSLFFLTGRYPIISSVIFCKLASNSRKKRNKKIVVYFKSTKYISNIKFFGIYNNYLPLILSNSDNNKFLRNIFLDGSGKKYVVIVSRNLTQLFATVLFSKFSMNVFYLLSSTKFKFYVNFKDSGGVVFNQYSCI